MNIPMPLIESACKRVEDNVNWPLPLRLRGIKIDRELIQATMEILNASPSRTLPQNCRNDIWERTPDGLDRRIKLTLNTDLRTANIISDILADAGIVEIVQVINPDTGRWLKGSRLLNDWCWGKVDEYKAVVKDVALDAQRNDLVRPTFPEKPTAEVSLNMYDYLNCREVRRFISWLESKIDGNGAFNHRYYLKKAGRQWSCSCLFNAYQSYWWPFNVHCPVSGNKFKGTGPAESFAFLTRLASAFRQGVCEGDVDTTRRCALAMLEWGGVLNKNRERIEEMGKGVCEYFEGVSERLNLSKVKLGENYGMHIHMNSGFTKLYFLLVDNFIIYDGRVGAAMGLLARKYCEEMNLPQIPSTLLFSFGRGKEAGPYTPGPNRRDPSRGSYQFPEFTGDRWRHLHDNIKASWLLKEVADHTKSQFGQLLQDPPLNERLTAIQSALFMVGYDASGVQV